MDCVSNLPDEVLGNILSNLTTKEAALTSVLSKRWRNLLSFVPNLVFDDSVFLHPESSQRDRPEIVQGFTDFVDGVLALQGGNTTIKKFSLKCLSLTKADSNRVDGWISNVLARGVSDLDLLIILDVDDEVMYPLSPNTFGSWTLVRLKISSDIDIGWVAGSVSLPMLKTLVIDSARVDKFEILLHALPALEELVLIDVIWKDSDLKLSSPSLKTFTLNDNNGLRTISIDTPSLVYFNYTGSILLDYPVVNMKNLFDARINFLVNEEVLLQAREPDGGHLFFGQEDNDFRFANVWKLFHGIRHVPNLYLSANTLEVLPLCCESIPVFTNLKSLTIKSDKDQEWQAMPAILRNCPRLETLVIKGLLHYVTDKCGDACDCISREDKGHSLRSCPVKMLEIQGFQGTMKEMTMIKHFLDYFPSLKEMKIIEGNYPTELRTPEVSKRILQMIEDYNKISSCNVKLLMSNYLNEKRFKKKCVKKITRSWLCQSRPWNLNSV